MDGNETRSEPEIAAICHDVKVPAGPPLNAKQIERIAAGRYEGQELAGVLRIVRPGDTVLECGAGIGLVGATAVVKCGAKRLVSYEANPTLIPRVTALYAANGISDRATVNNEILTAGPDLPKSMGFFVRGNFLGSRLAADGQTKNVVDIPVADYAEVQATLQPDVLIMDIEGAEADFLRHADLSGLRAIVIELHPDVYGQPVLRECKTILLEAGFQRLDCSTRTVWTVARPD
jgi:FkbM family methyltransferase